MKTLILIPSILIGASSLMAQSTVKRSTLEIKETIIRIDTKVERIKEIETEKKKQVLTSPKTVAVLPEKSK